MSKTIPLTAALLIVAVSILIGAALLQRKPSPSIAPPTAAEAKPDSGLANAMTFTAPNEPKR